MYGRAIELLLNCLDKRTRLYTLLVLDLGWKVRREHVFDSNFTQTWQLGKSWFNSDEAGRPPVRTLQWRPSPGQLTRQVDDGKE